MNRNHFNVRFRRERAEFTSVISRKRRRGEARNQTMALFAMTMYGNLSKLMLKAMTIQF
jgi:hypothetical protein